MRKGDEPIVEFLKQLLEMCDRLDRTAHLPRSAGKLMNLRTAMREFADTYLAETEEQEILTRKGS